MPGLRAPDAEHVVCTRCKQRVNKLLCRYWYYRLGERGHGLDQEPREESVLTHKLQKRRLDQEGTLCGPCGDELADELEMFVLGRGLYARGVVRE